MNYVYLGMVINGGSAGIYMMPESMNKKLFTKLQSLGEYFEIEGAFVQEVMMELGSPEMLSKFKSGLYQFFYNVGLGDSFFWCMQLKRNQAWDRRLDQPFADHRN